MLKKIGSLLIHVKPKRNSFITVEFNTKSVGSETGKFEVLKILRAPNHDIVDNEEVWFKVNEKYSVDHAYANKTSRTAFCILAVSVGELITEVARTEMQTRAYAHHVASSLPVSKKRFLQSRSSGSSRVFYFTLSTRT